MIGNALKRWGPLAIIRFVFHLPNLARLILRLLADSRVPFYLKLLPYGALAYVVLPIDLLPEVKLLFVGLLDDVVIVYFLLRKFLQLCPKEIVNEHLAKITGKEQEPADVD